MKTSISVASTEAEREDVYRFRYRIYVEEMQRRQKHADHQARRIVDPLDMGGINLVARRGEEVIGVVRVNLARDGHLGPYERFYRMTERGADHPARTSICTRLMVVPEQRKGLLAVRLSKACLSVGLRAGVRWTYIDCNDHLVPFFTGLGYRRAGEPREHDEYGLVNVMLFDLDDTAHLEAIGSPLAKSGVGPLLLT